jgi:hypothetical protein
MQESLKLINPQTTYKDTLKKITYTVAEQRATSSLLQQVGDALEIAGVPETVDLYAAAVELAAVYRLDLWAVLDELRRIYGGATEIPLPHLADLALQTEAQTRNYELQEETVEKALALVRPEGFQKGLDEQGAEVYTAEISYPIDRQRLLLSWEEMRTTNQGDFGFHYDPYNFDSNPEKSFFEQMLAHLNLNPDDVEDIYFTGALTTPDKTEFWVDYKGLDDRWHRYTPDFIIRRQDGRCLIVEIKSAQFAAVTQEDLAREERGEAVLTVEGRKAVALRKWERLNPDHLKYQIIYAGEETVAYDQTQTARLFVEGKEIP